MDFGFDGSGRPLQDSRLRGGPTYRNDAKCHGIDVVLRGDDLRLRGNGDKSGGNQLFYAGSSGWLL